MSGRGWLPFRAEFRKPIESGRKTATSRTKRYGGPGDILRTPFGDVVLLDVVERMLWDVAENHWREEGVESSDHFERVWKKLHPRAGFRPNEIVYLHRFRLLGRSLDAAVRGAGDDAQPVPMSRCPYTLPTSHSIYRCKDEQGHPEEHTVYIPAIVEADMPDLPNPPPQCTFRMRQRGTNRYFRCREDPGHEGDHRLGIPQWYVEPMVMPR